MSESDFIETATGNRIARSSVLCGTQNIRIHGKSTIHEGVVIRGDLASVKLGKFCTISKGTVLRPAYRLMKGQLVFFALSVGNHVVIDENSVVEASMIGSGVYIGKNCVISKRCVIKDCCWIKDGTVLPPDTVVAPFSVYEGCPGTMVDELPECAPDMLKSIIEAKYNDSNNNSNNINDS